MRWSNGEGVKKYPDCSRCDHPYARHRDRRQCSVKDCLCLLYALPSNSAGWVEPRFPRRYKDNRSRKNSPKLDS